MGSIMLLDAASMYFRAFYGVPETMTAPDGTPVNAVKGLLDMISRLIRARHPERLVACMDASWRPAFRTAALPSYKAHRARPDGSEEVPAALERQLPIIVDVLSAAGIVMAWADGYEADDIIGTLAAQATSPVEIVTGDRDLFQLVDDERGITIAYIARGLANLEIVDEAAVTKKYQIPGRDYAAFAALRGDPSDGLPGVPGVGEKTAAALVRVFGSVEAILAAIDAGHGGFPAGSRAEAGRGPRLPGRVHAGGQGGGGCAGEAGRRRAAVRARRSGPDRRARRALGSRFLARARPVGSRCRALTGRRQTPPTCRTTRQVSSSALFAAECAQHCGDRLAGVGLPGCCRQQHGEALVDGESRRSTSPSV